LKGFSSSTKLFVIGIIALTFYFSWVRVFLYQSHILPPSKSTFAYISDQPPRGSLEKIFFFFVAYLDRISNKLDQGYYVGDLMFSIEFKMMCWVECHVAHDLDDITIDKHGLWLKKTKEMAFQYGWWFLCSSQI
jgi:hypothetical protein